MDNERELEVIRDEMEQTRANLANKLGALEEQVRETVSNASETVTSTVEGVKEVVSNVSETVGNVGDALNVPKQIEQHPWVAMGVAVAAGFFVAHLLGSNRAAAIAPQGPQPEVPPPPEPRHEPQPRSEPKAKAASGPSLMSQAAALLPSLESLVPDFAGKAAAAIPSFDEVAPELKKLGDTVVAGLGGLAVGGVMNLVRELAAEALPDAWRGEITKLVDDVTLQLGGKPLVAKPKEEEQKPSASTQKPAEGQEARKPNEPQGNQWGRREGRNQLVGQS